MSGALAKVRIPSNLAPGNYLVRHEIIALHLAPKAEFYPGCAQLTVGGSQTGKPSAGETVKFPGGYQDGDAGIRGVNAYGGPYAMPGPAIAKLAASGGGAPAPAPAPAPGPGAPSSSTTIPVPAPGTPSTTAAPSPTPTKAPGKSCKKKNTQKRRSADYEEVAEYRPRHVSRIMRRAAFAQSH